LILQRISESFGRVIPGDILQFVVGNPSAGDPSFDVEYVIKASGSAYYPEKQEHLSESKRDWYTGISFKWNFNIKIPGADASTFQFNLESQPAQLFNVAYTQTAGSGAAMTPIEVYGAMADSAFSDFGTKLLSELSVR
jgi:hypothetical protein